jgi:endonuclease/exonuclease/phosphatase family metal-dependent hydrolase
MHSIGRLVPLLALPALAACADRQPFAPDRDMALSRNGVGAVQITVMQRNMYVGADVDAVIAALATGDEGKILDSLTKALQTFRRTDLAVRINAMAGEIARHRPQVVGLQEVYKLDVYAAAIGLPDSLEAHVDFETLLEDALAARGLTYVVAARDTTTDAFLVGGAIHLVDHDLLLVDPARVELAGEPAAQIFATNIGDVGGVNVVRGYVLLQAAIEGVPTLLVNTHLESGEGPAFTFLRYAQAAELAQALGAAPRVILTGDFNEEAGSPMYEVLAGSGLTDTWAALRPAVAGLTCCQAPDLSNPRPTFDQRIDLVWTRGFEGPSGAVQGQIGLIAAQPSARVKGASGLIWPSDHAGVVATLLLPPPSQP